MKTNKINFYLNGEENIEESNEFIPNYLIEFCNKGISNEKIREFNKIKNSPTFKIITNKSKKNFTLNITSSFGKETIEKKLLESNSRASKKYTTEFQVRKKYEIEANLENLIKLIFEHDVIQISNIIKCFNF